MYNTDSTQLLIRNCRFIRNSGVPLVKSGILKWVEIVLKIDFSDISLTYEDNIPLDYSQKTLLYSNVQTSVHFDSKLLEILILGLSGNNFQSSLEFTVYTENRCAETNEDQASYFFFFLRTKSVGGEIIEENDDEGHSVEDLLISAASLFFFFFSRSLKASKLRASLASLILVLASLAAASSALSFSRYSAVSFSFCSLSSKAIRYLLVASKSPLKLFQVPPKRGLTTCKERSIRSEHFHLSRNESVNVYGMKLYNDVYIPYLDELAIAREMIAVLHKGFRVLLEELHAARAHDSHFSLWDAAGDSRPILDSHLIILGSIHDCFDNLIFTLRYTYTVLIIESKGEQGAVTFPRVLIYEQCSCGTVPLTKTTGIATCFSGVTALARLVENAYQTSTYVKGYSVILTKVNYDVGTTISLDAFIIFSNVFVILNVIVKMFLISFDEDSQEKFVTVKLDQDGTFRLTRMLKKQKTLSIVNLYSKII